MAAPGVKMICRDHHWVGIAPEPENYFGFIYVITNLVSNRMYIGKKQYLIHRKVKTASGRRRKYTTSSGWETYTGSSASLNEDILKLGKENFRFEIVNQHSTKGTLHYAEIELQVFADVLRARFPNGERAFYNKSIAGTKFLPKDEYPEIAERQKGLKNTIFKAIHNGNHPTLGRGHRPDTIKLMSEKSKHWWSSLSTEERKAHSLKTANPGEKNGRSKVSKQDVAEIREKWASGKYKSKISLAREYGIGQSQIGRILSNAQWTNI